MAIENPAPWSYVLKHAGRDVPISDGDVVLGRSHNAGIRIDDPSVSRSHALLSLREGRAIIRDLGSSNGLFVNGRKVAGQVPVADGDTIGLGSATAVLSIVAPPDLELKTAMIPTMPAGATHRPSETVTRFITTADVPAAAPAPAPAAAPARAPAPRRGKKARSIDDFNFRGDEEVAAEERAEPSADLRGEPERITDTEAHVEMFDPAPLGPRVLSAIIDAALSAAIAFVCFVPALVAMVAHASLRERAGSGLAFWALVGFCGAVGVAAILVYYLSGWSGRGATAGQRAAGVRLVSTGGGFVTGGRAALRFAVLLLYWATAGLLALTVFADSERRGLADRVAGSKVVSA